MIQFLLAIPFRSATFAWRVVFGLKMSPLRRATVARRGILRCVSFVCRVTVPRRIDPLRVTTSLFLGPQISLVEVIGFWRRCSEASFRSLRRFFFGSPTGNTVAFSAGTLYSSTASVFLSAEVGFSSSGRASIPWQEIVSNS
jgi:hypothetical protein